MVKNLKEFSLQKGEQLNPQKVQVLFAEIVKKYGIKTISGIGLYVIGFPKEEKGLHSITGWKQTGFYEDSKRAVSVCCDFDNGDVMIIDNNDIYVVTNYTWQDGNAVFTKDQRYRYSVQLQEFVIV